ncbi:MAG: hypothetical protein HQ504_07010 [Rhodospirillaceae bacterium]|nr:hypothetical protein [Rhodospirillaceae bacterium]
MSALSIRHVGLKIDFYHPQSDTLKLSEETEDSYSIHKEKAAIFIESTSSQAYSTEDVLEWCLLQTGKSLTEFLPDMPEPGPDTAARVALQFPIRLPENVFHMMTDQGAVDIKALNLAIEVVAAGQTKEA